MVLSACIAVWSAAGLPTRLLFPKIGLAVSSLWSTARKCSKLFSTLGISNRRRPVTVLGDCACGDVWPTRCEDPQDFLLTS